MTKKFIMNSALLSAIFLFTCILSGQRATYAYTSGFDEHTHLSYVQYAHEFKIPADGYPMNDWAKTAFSCHPHSIFGPMTQVKCGDVLEGYGYPTGGSNTSQAWPPGYFLVVSILMRPFELFISDPLFSARFGTALLWSLGITAIAFALIRRNIPRLNVFSTTILITALPVTAYYSSFVTPYAATPLLVAAFLFLTKNRIGVSRFAYQPMDLVFILKFVVLSIVSMFFIPHFILGVAALGLALMWSELDHYQNVNKLSPFVLLRSVIFPVVILGLSKLIFDFWPKIQAHRKVPYPSDVREAMANNDPADSVYDSAIALIQDRLFAFWPRGISIGYPSTGYLALLESFWIYLLFGMSILLLLGTYKTARWTSLAFGIVLGGFSLSILYAIQLPTPPPLRYGFTVVVLACLMIADERVFRSNAIGTKVLALIVSITFILNFGIAPIYTEAGECSLGADRLIHCTK